MKIIEEKSNGLTREFSAVISFQDFETEVTNKIVSISKNVKIAGFRPGKAPMHILKQRYRASVLGEVLDDMLKNAADEIIKDKKLRPAVMPEINLKSFAEGKDIEFSVNMEVLPEITVGDFSKITLDKLTAEVPAEEVEKAIDTRSSMGVLSDTMDTFVKYQSANAIRDAAQNQGAAGLGTQLGTGLALGELVKDSLRGTTTQPAPQASEAKFCPSCGASNPKAAKFCVECGQKLAQKGKCPACGAEISGKSKFCPECGEKL